MTPCWLGIEPAVRRRLVLCTHRWVADRVFGGRARPADLLDDLAAAGRLTVALEALVPPEEAPRWRPWIRLVRYDLRRALTWPPARRTEAWCRWLFLIPYSLPVGVPETDAGSRRALPRSGP